MESGYYIIGHMNHVICGQTDLFYEDYLKRIVYHKAGKFWEGVWNGTEKLEGVLDWTSFSNIGNPL